MMSDRIMDTLRLSAALLLLLSLFSCGNAIQFPDSQLTHKWAEQMQEELVQLIDAESGIQKLKEIFLQLQRHYVVKQNNAQQLVAKAAFEIDKLLANRSKALEALATAAEKLQKDHQWKDDLDVNDTIYYNAKDKYDINDTEIRQYRVRPEFKEDPAFKRIVSYNTTAVHIPTDIYEGCVDSQRLVEKLQTKFREQSRSNAARLAPRVTPQPPNILQQENNSHSLYFAFKVMGYERLQVTTSVEKASRL